VAGLAWGLRRDVMERLVEDKAISDSDEAAAERVDGDDHRVVGEIIDLQAAHGVVDRRTVVGSNPPQESERRLQDQRRPGPVVGDGSGDGMVDARDGVEEG